MEIIAKTFAQLTNSIHMFKDEYKLHYPTDPMSDIWKVKDILCHITYWHEYYVKNLKAEAKGTSFVMPKTKINLRGLRALGFVFNTSVAF